MLKLLYLVVIAVLVTACATVPETGRKQLSIITAQQETQLGIAEFAKLKQSIPLSGNREQITLLERVGRRIAAVAPLPGAQWEYVMFDKSDEANAFCLPGGKVGVYSGILAVTQNEAGLATVVGHEIAHAVARHGAERVSQQLLLESGGQILDIATASRLPKWRGAVLGAYGIGSELGVLLPYSRTQELEADKLGLLYMARAGYDPRQAIAFWQRFIDYQAAHKQGKTIEFLSTHPLDETRIRALQKHMDQAIGEYRKTQ